MFLAGDRAQNAIMSERRRAATDQAVAAVPTGSMPALGLKPAPPSAQRTAPSATVLRSAPTHIDAIGVDYPAAAAAVGTSAERQRFRLGFEMGVISERMETIPDLKDLVNAKFGSYNVAPEDYFMMIKIDGVADAGERWNLFHTTYEVLRELMNPMVEDLGLVKTVFPDGQETVVPQGLNDVAPYSNFESLSHACQPNHSTIYRIFSSNEETRDALKRLFVEKLRYPTDGVDRKAKMDAENTVLDALVKKMPHDDADGPNTVRLFLYNVAAGSAVPYDVYKYAKRADAVERYDAEYTFTMEASERYLPARR